MIPGKEVGACIHPRQRPRFLLAALFGLPFGLLLFITLVLVFPFTLLFLFVLWFGARIAYMHLLGATVRVSEFNFPRIHAIAEDVKNELGWKKPVSVFVYEKGEFNAVMARFFRRRAIFLNSDMIDRGVSDDEVKWIIARFIGNLRAQRRSGPVGQLIRLTEHMLIFNLFILPWERAAIYSGDRIALRLINGDISTAVSAMQKLLVGRDLGYSLNPAGIIDQHRDVKGSLFAFLARIGSTFPHMTARFVDLIAHAKVRYPDQFAVFVSQNPDINPDALAQLKS